MKAEDVRKVGVVGCGVMGAGIVEACARAGMDVLYLEANPDLVERGRSRIETSTLRAVERGKLDERQRAEELIRIAGTTTIDDLADRDLVIEAATEDHDTKREIFRRLDGVTRPEVVRAITTSDETVEFSRGFGAVLGKTTVLSKDRAGFIVNMLLIPYLNGAVRMLDDGFATREDIDTAVSLGLAHPMGPLQLLDLIGLDTALFVANVLFEEFKEPLFAPPPLLKRMVTAGRLGRKSGAGFYDYTS